MGEDVLAPRQPPYSRARSGCREEGDSADERPEGGGYLHGAQRPEPQRPAAVELLAEGMGDIAVGQLLPVKLCSLVSRRSLESRIEAVATVINGPDRKPVGDRAGLDRKSLVLVHLTQIGSRTRALEATQWAAAIRSPRSSIQTEQSRRRSGVFSADLVQPAAPRSSGVMQILILEESGESRPRMPFV
jgi:hypothetical protein